MDNSPIDLPDVTQQFPRSSAYDLHWIMEKQMGLSCCGWMQPAAWIYPDGCTQTSLNRCNRTQGETGEEK